MEAQWRECYAHRMMRWLILLFIVVPLVELFLLIKIGELTGLLPTLMLVIITGVIGAWLTRREGFRVLRAIQEDLHNGRIPAANLADGALIAAAGLLLLTPGLMTDACGFLLLIPPCRRWIRRLILQSLSRRFSPPSPPTIDI